MPSLIVKKHVTSDRRLLLAICDANLLGEVYEEDGKQLDMTADFYKGEPMEEDAIVKLIGKAYMINAVGEKSVTLCHKVKLITDTDPDTINKIPYIQLVVF